MSGHWHVQPFSPPRPIQVAAAHQSLLPDAQMLSRPNSDLALVYFGTFNTSNELHDEASMAGDPTQYCHISVVHPLQRPGLSMLRSLRQGGSPAGLLDKHATRPSTMG